MIMHGYAMAKELYMLGVRHHMPAHDILYLGNVVIDMKVRMEGRASTGLRKKHQYGGGGAARGGGVGAARGVGFGAPGICQHRPG